jgi:predicted phage terminase large subunit-like protein
MKVTETMARLKMEAATATVQLHPAQRSFLDSNSLFRAFVGGVGSGKSWAGSYDLIRRARAGRLYMVVAPTYAMLADATFRSFLGVAGQLGVVNARDVKKSAPPSIKLRTGAEVLFRSADEPDRLRGPNLSGLWLDEASLMALDAFTVSIGRLREAGEQGWLTATFTPKGKGHWTFDTFATGRPDTAIFYARTRDNPFLPANFSETVRLQYTSRLALQELEGEFTDSDGSMFNRAWFGTLPAPPRIVRRLRAWDLAGTPRDPRKNRDPDYTAGVLLGRAEDGSTVILDVKRLRGSPRQVEEAIRQAAELDGKATAIWLEQEPGSAGATVVDHYARRVLAGFNFRAERSTGDKATRSAPLAAAAEHGLVKLLAGHWNKDFLDEVEVFPQGAHDDQVDACSLAFNKLTALHRFWMRVGGETFDFGGDAPPPVPRRVVRPDGTVLEEVPGMGTQVTYPGTPARQGLDIRPGAAGWERRPPLSGWRPGGWRW